MKAKTIIEESISLVLENKRPETLEDLLKIRGGIEVEVKGVKP